MEGWLEFAFGSWEQAERVEDELNKLTELYLQYQEGVSCRD